MIRDIARTINDRIWIESVRKFRTRMGWVTGSKFQSYHNRAKKRHVGALETPAEIVAAAKHYQETGWAAFTLPKISSLMRSVLEKVQSSEQNHWNSGGEYVFGDIWRLFPEIEKSFMLGVGAFVENAFKSYYKIFYGKMYQSKNRSSSPSGSQLWHADGGPGTCMNLMLCVSNVSRRNGAMELLSWGESLSIFEKERAWHRKISRRLSAGQHLSKEEYRAERAKWMEQIILRDPNIKVHQPEGPEGMVLAFSNNLIHRGGYPEIGQERIVKIFHIYPSCMPISYNIYHLNGIEKTASHPACPEF